MDKVESRLLAMEKEQATSTETRRLRTRKEPGTNGKAPLEKEKFVNSPSCFGTKFSANQMSWIQAPISRV